MELVRLFVEGKHEIKSREGKAQGDPTLLGAYALEVTSLIHFLSDLFYQRTQKQKTAFVEDLTVAGEVSKIKAYWDKLQQHWSLFGCFLKPTKSY